MMLVVQIEMVAAELMWVHVQKTVIICWHPALGAPNNDIGVIIQFHECQAVEVRALDLTSRATNSTQDSCARLHDE